MWRFPFFLLFSEWGVFCHRVCKKKIANCITFLVFKCLFLNYVWLMPICVSVPTLLTQNQSSVLSPKRDFAAVAVGNTGRAAVYETSDVFLCLLFLFFFNRLNINLLKELRQKQWFQTLIKKKRRFHPSDVNKAVSCSYCEAGESLWPFCVSRDLPWHSAIFEVMMITSCLLLRFCPRLSTNRLSVWDHCIISTPLHYVIVCFLRVKGECVIVEKDWHV